MSQHQPRNTPYAVCLTFDFDAFSVWLSSDVQATPARLSRGEYGANIGLPRILELLRSHQIKSTFFVPGHSAESFPECLEKILAEGHEVANHGYGHEDVSLQSPDEEESIGKVYRRISQRISISILGLFGCDPAPIA
jgi:hypothetical protein